MHGEGARNVEAVIVSLGTDDLNTPADALTQVKEEATGVGADGTEARRRRVTRLVRRRCRSLYSFDVPVGKAALSHHFSVLRGAGLGEQRDEGPKRVNRLRRQEFDARFPGLLDLLLRPDGGAC
ncbi:ArsR/SmtB family transcription factor [Streptomyces purpurascens]|uniref:ArsR/SmtB family transcription factor n=1 Tax=Streptomyces purpurascens TaxID=1924 RepID=UPI0019C3B39F|nr:helix-turn-helix domain-containing protein [Streptomyces purpurascens]MCE7050130.1 helix-turn-helix domain-containing protein [Streptomyces purpurascens]GHA25461.1 hypothetical protein GCM10010303_40000 [Streptomyces purpurascens]